MAFPAAVKTWQISPNNAVAVAASAKIINQKTWNKIVKLMQAPGTNPWVATQSCNAGNSTAGGPNIANDIAHGGGGAVGSGDRWTIDGNDMTSNGGGTLITVDNDVNFGNAGTRHSWIVLRQTGIYSNFEVCFDCSSTTAGGGVVVFSPSVGFSGGTTTNRPTASDEVYLIGGTSPATVTPATNTQRILHYTQSTDGQCSRLWIYQASVNIAFFLFDVMKNPLTGWTNPAVAFGESTTTAPDTTNVVTSSNFYGNRRFRSRYGSAVGQVALIGATQEHYSNGTALRSATGIGTAVNTFTSEWPVMPIGLATVSNATSGGGTSGNASVSPLPGGKIGNLFDMWWRPSGLAVGDSFPNNAATRQYMSIGEVVVPWLGDGTTLTTA